MKNTTKLMKSEGDHLSNAMVQLKRAIQTYRHVKSLEQLLKNKLK